MDIFSKSDQDMFLEILDGLPPSTWLKDCDTQDRRNSWILWKNYYSLIHDVLKAYFSGKVLPIDHFSHEFRQICIAHMNYYLALYKVITLGWKYIKKDWETEFNNFPDEPGKMLYLIIRNEASAALISCVFPEYLPSGNFYKEFSPRKYYKFGSDCSKVERMVKGKQELKKPDHDFINRHLKELYKKQSEMAPFFFFYTLCIQSCEKASSKDEALKKSLKILREETGEYRAKIRSASHPRKGIKGHKISNGVKLT